MTALAIIGALALIPLALVAFVVLDCACAKIARALREAMRP